MSNLRQRTIIYKDTKPISLVECGYEECASLHAFGPAIRTYHLLHFVISGKGEFINPNGKRYTVGENDMFIIKPYEVTYYEADENEPWTYAWIGFNTEMPLPAALTESDVINAPYLRNIFLDAINDEQFADGSTNGAYETYVVGHVMQMLGLLMRESEQKREGADDYVKRAIAIIESEHHTWISASRLAERLHLNRSYFSEIFKEKTGVSPHKYLTDYRMKKSAELLTKRRLSVSVTALSVGYTDIYVFSRAFKKYYGVTPTEYIKEHR